MHDETISKAGAEERPGPTARSDANWQRVVLDLLLEDYPQQLNRAEIAREILKPDAAFAERDALDRAIEALISTGLAHSVSGFILLSRAARRFSDLEGSG